MPFSGWASTYLAICDVDSTSSAARCSSGFTSPCTITTASGSCSRIFRMSSTVIWWWTWQAPSQANTLPARPLPLPLADQRLDPLPVLLRVELVGIGRRQVHAPGLQRHLVGQVLIGHEQDVPGPQLLGEWFAILAALLLVQQVSDSAFTSAYVLT